MGDFLCVWLLADLLLIGKFVWCIFMRMRLFLIQGSIEPGNSPAVGLAADLSIPS